MTLQSGYTAAVVTPDHAQVPNDDAVKDRLMCESCETTENQVLAAILSMKKRCFIFVEVPVIVVLSVQHGNQPVISVVKKAILLEHVCQDISICSKGNNGDSV